MEETQRGLCYGNRSLRLGDSSHYLQSNHGSWETAKSIYGSGSEDSSVFYIDGSAGFTVKDAKKIIEYLQKKIDYLEN